ncbi:PHD-finger domain-containing protein [Coniella lustricola]|uniref:Chromatin modification-related protein n=1 Tax=Coniella lustricola TaxID=2025994 RepID=A0A2T3A2M0_9PEZI|nr:PHD-finger domain-containing protein [Coniella lustricola]
MPRDDLSIDFVKKNMPPIESLDPALILDDWTNRVSNLPEEIKFIQDEITEKDRQVAECLKLIEERDARIQRWIKANGSHTQNPREESFRQVIRDNYNKAEQLSDEKLALTQRLQTIIDKHIRHLDVQIKMLYDRNEPGFTDPDEVPSLLRASAANTSAPSVRAINPSANPVTAALSPLANPSNPLAPKGTNPQVRGIQTTNHISSSAPASPAANILKRGVRESSAGPAIGSLQRGPRSALGLNTAPNPSSGLARHSSLGPGTPKGHTATGVQRAGSAGPRTGVKGAVATGRKSTPSGSISGRTMKKPPPGGVNKSGLNRVRKTVKNSPSSNADSELSDADSSIASGDESDGPRTGGPPGSSGGGGGGAPRTKREHDEDHSYVEEDEGSDDKKYCICQKVSFGDMIACDNEDCPYEWFHWTCVGLKSEPQGGKWFCPVCTASMKKVK